MKKKHVGLVGLVVLCLIAGTAVAATRGGESEIRFDCRYLEGIWVGESGENDDRYSWRVKLSLTERQGDLFTFDFVGEFFDAAGNLESMQIGQEFCDGRTVATVVLVEGGEMDGLTVQWEYRIINLNRNHYVYQFQDGSGVGPVFRSFRQE